MASLIPSFSELYQKGSNEVTSRNDKLTARQAGSIVDTELGASSAIADEILRVTLIKIAETFIDTAKGEALEKVAKDRYGLDKQGEVFSVGNFVLSRPNTSGGDGVIEIGSQFSTDFEGETENVLFETTETKQMTGTQVTVAAKAVSGGTKGNVSAGAITVVKTPLFDSSITVNNTEKFVGGQEEESDVQFRSRIKGYLKTLRRGTPGALKFGAEFVAGVANANLDESTADQGYITLFIADADGQANAALVQAVEDEIINWRAAGVVVNVSGATVVSQPITFSLTLDAGVDTELIKIKAIEAAENYRDSLNVGSTLFLSGIGAAIQSVDGVLGATITVPTGDVQPDPDEIIRGGTITVN